MPAVVDELHLPADVADARVGERLDEPRERVALPDRVGVGERDDVAARALDRGVLRADLAAVRELEHDVGARVARAPRRRVGRAVAGDDDLEPLTRVVERQRVGDLGGDHVLLGVGGDDERDARLLGRRQWRQARRGAAARARPGALRSRPVRTRAGRR